MDAFSTGDLAVPHCQDKIGFMSVLTAEMWKNHEEYFAMRADWVDKIPRLPKRF